MIVETCWLSIATYYVLCRRFTQKAVTPTFLRATPDDVLLETRGLGRKRLVEIRQLYPWDGTAAYDEAGWLMELAP